MTEKSKQILKYTLNPSVVAYQESVDYGKC